MSRPNVRDQWIRYVLASTELHNGTKVVLWALSLHMDASGRAKRRRDDLAADCNLANPRRVSDHIKKARDEGFLSADAGGINGQVVTYSAQVPGSPRQGPSSGRRGGGWQGPTDRDPQTTLQTGPGSPWQGPIRARVTKEHPDNGAPSALERGAVESTTTSRAGINAAEWMPTPATSSSCDHTGRVA